jgi:NADH-quinone oxidoreductase subunit G
MSDQVNLKIDDVALSVPKGTLVVDAAKMIDNAIPVFCYHPKMAPVGMCRMCLVEIGLPVLDRATGQPMLNEDGTPQVSFRGLQTACTVQVSEGMVVRTTTDPVLKAREDVIEFLLTSHPLDCPICDKGGECPLQNLTMAHGKGDSRMDYSLKLKLDKHVPLGELIYLDRERCIQCGRCVRFQEEIVDDPVIRFHNRGRSLEIVTMSEPGFDSYWSGNTTDICPVGALTTSDFRFGARPWELTPVATLSPHCPSGSNMTFSTRREAKSGGRSVIKRIMPRQNEPVNEIWISDRDRFVHHFADAPDRLKKPLLRKNGQLVEVEWNEALDAVAGKLQQGKTAVAGISGDRVSNEDLFLFQKLFRKGLNSPNIDLANRRLAGGDVVAKVGISQGSNLLNLGKGDAIVVVASDLHEEVPVWWLRVKQAAQRGASLVILNVRPTRLDDCSRHVIHYRPGKAVATVRQLVNDAKVATADADNSPLKAAADVIMQANNVVAFYGAEGLTYAETDAVARLLANLLLIKNEEAHAGRPNNGLIPVWPHNNTQGAWDMGIHPALEPGYKAAATPGMTAAANVRCRPERRTESDVCSGSRSHRRWPDGRPGQAGLFGGAGAVFDRNGRTGRRRFARAKLGRTRRHFHQRRTARAALLPRHPTCRRCPPRLANSGPDWRARRAGETGFCPSLVFRDLAKAVPQYKTMDYRALARVEKQWPDVGGDDLYYGGNAYENRVGLGMQWAVTAESTAVDLFEVNDVAENAPKGVALVRTAALFTPGTLINHTDLLKQRMAKPTLYVNQNDAATLR